MAVHFDEEDGLRVAGKADLHVVLDEVDGHVVHEFQRTGQDVGGDDAGHGFGSLLHVVEHGHHGLGGLRRGHEFEDGAADHAEGAFGTHEQAAEVVAGRALDGAGAAFHQLAGVVIEFEAHDVIFGDAVFQAAQAAGVFRNVAADGGDGLRTRIRGIEEALGSHGGGELGRHNAGLDDGEEVFFIDLDDLVQSLRQDDHGFVGVGHGPAAEVGPRAADGHGQAVGVAALNESAELFGGGGAQDKAGNDRGQHGGIIGVALPVRFAGEDVLFADEVFEFLDEGCAGHDFLRIKW